MSGALSTIRRRLLGLLLIVVVIAFFAVTILFYNKTFTSNVQVTLRAGSVGNDLAQDSDVKVRGLVVGSVQSVQSTGDGAVVTMELDPAQVDQIPANVSAELLPTSLFGERYVDLEIPANPSAEHLTTGADIPQDRSASAVEVQKVLDDLMPVLQAVQPQKLSVTLTAISQALQGRGPELGRTLSQLGQYVGEFNPHLPQLEHDLTALTAVSNTYNTAAPHLLNALDDLTTTTKTIVDQQSNLQVLYSTLTTASGDLNNFLVANKNNLIQVAANSESTLNVLARYSPEYPCFLQGMAGLVPKLDKAFGKGTNEPGLHAKIEVSVSRGPYLPGKDDPQYADNRGPRCYQPTSNGTPFPQYPPDGPLKDGSTAPAPANTSGGGGLLPLSGASDNGTSGSATPGDLGLPNSPAEEGFIAAMLAPSMGEQPQNVPSWSSVLVGPLFRGAEVDFK